VESCTSSTHLNGPSRASYPVRLEARYRSLERRRKIAGSGTTVAMSSTGLVIASQHEVPFGLRIEIHLDWPSLLEAAIPLKLVVRGRVTLSEGLLFGVEFTTYQFRTKKSPVAKPAAFQQNA